MDVQMYIDKLYKRHHTRNPYELANSMGIMVHFIDLGKTRGFCYTKRRIKQIFINGNLPEHIKRFVLAHEIGHIVMHDKYNAPFLQSTFFVMDRYEVEANTFAMHLLLSDEQIAEHHYYTIQEWAMLYGLPDNVVALRFKE